MILVLIGTSALFLLLAIASYSPNDPSFNYTGNNQEVSNLVGSSGAFFADIVLFLFGWMAYLLPLALVYIGLHLLLSGRAPSPPLLLVVRTIGWVGLMLCACILLDVHAPLASQLPSGSGGVFGFHLAQQGEQVFGWVGMTVLCVAGVIIGLQAAVGFSWLDVAELIGRLLTKVAGASRDFYDVRYDRYQARRAVAKTVKQEADETKALIKQRKVSLDNDQRASDNTAPSSVQILATAKAEKPPSKLQQKRLFDSNSTSELPDVDLLDEKREDTKLGFSPDALEAMSKQLELKLADFGVQASVVSVLPGPVVTRFEVQPAAGVKVQKISALAKDLARSMAVISVRIVEVIPGKSVVGIEIPNEHREMVQLKEVIHSFIGFSGRRVHPYSGLG